MAKEYIHDQPYSCQWKDMNTPLFDYCSDLLRFIAPDQWVSMQALRYTEGRVDTGQKGKRKISEVELADSSGGGIGVGVGDGASASMGKVTHIAGAWSGVAINQRQRDNGEAHWDYRDGRAKFNLAIPYGMWQGGDMVLWGLGKKIELRRGEGLFFLGSLIAHSVVDITGGARNSLDLFSHQSNFQAHRTEKIHNNRVQQWKKGSTLSAAERRRSKKIKRNTVHDD